MYSTCISCGSNLGSNAVLEAFPVGRRLAFDPHHGRLWVLCSACRRWNLTPLEERWEAVEEAERLFERATIGGGTTNVALGRVGDGTELVRIGRVDRPELAFWRYGDRLIGRWRRNRRNFRIMMLGGMALGLAPVTSSMSIWAVLGAWAGVGLIRDHRALMRARDGSLVRSSHAPRAFLVPAATEEGWALEIRRLTAPAITLTGDDGLRGLRMVLPRVNHGGRPEQVRNAVSEVERLGSAEAVLRQSAVELQDTSNMVRYRFGQREGLIESAHPVIQLALEMVANEESERQALSGELSMLEREWREAEELAAIADDLLFPAHLCERLRRLRRGPRNSPAEWS